MPTAKYLAGLVAVAVLGLVCGAVVAAEADKLATTSSTSEPM